MVLMAAYQVLLHRYSGQDDLLVGTPMLGRSRPEHRGIIGYFANPVVVRSDLSGNPAFTTYVQQVREAVIGAIEHQDFPFPLLVERLNLARDPARSPLFQTLFVLGKSQIGSEVDGRDALPLDPLPLGQQAGQFELQLEIDEVGDALFGYLKYNTDLFDATTIDQMAGHFQRLVEGLVHDPACPIDNLPLLGAAERQQIMLTWNATETPYPLDRCLHEFIEDQVARTPDAPVLIFEETCVSYAELNRHANQLAHHLRRTGVGPETMVGVCMERSYEMVISLLAVLKAGGAYVPFDPTYPRDHLAFMVADSQVPVLLTQEKLRPHLPTSTAQVIAVDTAWPQIAQESSANPPVCTGPHNAAYMIYTSGSTGRPKGAINEHRGIVNRLLWMQDAYRLDASDRVLQKTPFSFDVSVWEFFWPLMTGACLVVARPEGHRDPAYLVQIIQQHQITTLHFVPSMLETFLHAAHVERCTSIRRVICSGEALAYELQARFFARLDTELHNLYGPTEAAVDVTYWACQQPAARPVVPIGRPIANIQMYVLDRYQQPVPVGVPGELYIGGIGVGRGYWNRPELTRERFLPDPFRDEPGAQLYRTGDLARFWPDGTIEYLGRLDHQVKIRGFRIELGEIEMVLSTFPGVRATVVMAREDAPGDRRLVAYLVSDEGVSPSISQLRAYLKEQLPEYMVPSAFVALPELPLTPNGKVNRRALPAPEDLRPTLDTAYVAPRSELERTIARHWQEVLGVPRVGIHDNFFDLGGHSLRVAKLHRRLTEALGRELPLTDLFAYPTVAALATYLESPRIDTAAAGVEARAARQQAALGRQKQRAEERRAQYG
jgi:amino acid adenylation domain-containing protein